MKRSELQQRNRQALIAAAVDLIAGQGYRAATVEAIAAEADLSTGAVYSAFGGKRELFYAAIAECRAQATEELDLPADGSVEQVLRRFGAAMAASARAEGARRLYQFEVELLALALHDDAVRDRLRADGDALADFLAAALVDRPASDGSRLGAEDARRVATLAVALARGLVQRGLWADDTEDLAAACAVLGRSVPAGR
ncbi:regulatory protein TetR [Kribbella flavida DSM 17836]|uniref:Regulatory protein TetR n=1 Tax=Kribbella flavida (strain DSM 17836 / JCM 10339 / NBRC 14399) TaxID=479435 RepID=D2PSE1_KRIFD|nr:TetR/AcrR family transcriptional regulator [Kribbella flavida]ADB33079.1 regulatory protein TetR [Kribbella flavida DSM 17836]